jgi:hypothetical protein
MVAPTVAGTVTGVKATFRKMDGTVVNAALENLTTTEHTGEPDLFYVDVSQALHQTYLKPLGRGTRYEVVWSKAGVAQEEVDTFVVALRSNI